MIQKNEELSGLYWFYVSSALNEDISYATQRAKRWYMSHDIRS